jgi:hypothetical protein
MEFIKKNKALFIIVIVVIVLVIIRSTGVNHFKNDAKKWAEPSLSKSNSLSPGQANSLINCLLININNSKLPESGIKGEIKNISADSILMKANIRSILWHKGPVLVYSSDAALSARIWVILSQMGCRSIYILATDKMNEAPEYKFQPDSVPATDLQ